MYTDRPTDCTTESKRGRPNTRSLSPFQPPTQLMQNLLTPTHSKHLVANPHLTLLTHWAPLHPWWRLHISISHETTIQQSASFVSSTLLPLRQESIPPPAGQMLPGLQSCQQADNLIYLLEVIQSDGPSRSLRLHLSISCKQASRTASPSYQWMFHVEMGRARYKTRQDVWNQCLGGQETMAYCV